MNNATYKPLSFMDMTKDTVTSQVSSATATQKIVEAAKTGFTHGEVATPMDPDITGETPQTCRNYYKMFADIIHDSAGKKVVHRGTDSDFEGIYGATKKVGTNRIPLGTTTSAATDGRTTWAGRIYEFTDWAMANGVIRDGDFIGIYPEPTGQGILLGDSTSFVASPYQTNFALFFTNLKTIVNERATHYGISVVIGTAQNMSEYQSGWMPTTVPSDIASIAIDYYGSDHTALEMDTQLRLVRSNYGNNKSLRLCEWGDYWHPTMDPYDRLYYLKGIYNVFTDLVNEGKMDLSGYWRANTGAQEGIMSGSAGNYTLNARGKFLAAYWHGGKQARVPVLDASGNY